MEITAFNPSIITNDPESVIALFEKLGFRRRHIKTGINGSGITSVRMRYINEDGKVFYLDITSAPVHRDVTSIRMNVDNFQEASDLLEKRGFKNVEGEKFTNTQSSKSAMMVSPSGIPINVTQYNKADD